MLSRRTIAWVFAIISIVIAAAFFWIFLFSEIATSSCVRTSIDTTPSGDKKKEVITFLYNCGPTVGISVHASVVNVNEQVDMNANGNALRIDSNQGQAWPRDGKGRPIIRAVWNSPAALTLYYSSKSDVFYQKNEVDGVTITIAPLTQ
jgi:hypothetical protein